MARVTQLWLKLSVGSASDSNESDHQRTSIFVEAGMVASLIKIAGGLPQSKSKNDDDAIDRLSHRYTCAVLIVFSIVVTTKSYVGDPIHCWMPKHFSKHWTKYTDSYCWVKGTHYVPLEPDVPIPKEHEDKDIIPYYQWIPIILLIQVCMYSILLETRKTCTNYQNNNLLF